MSKQSDINKCQNKHFESDVINLTGGVSCIIQHIWNVCLGLVTCMRSSARLKHFPVSPVFKTSDIYFWIIGFLWDNKWKKRDESLFGDFNSKSHARGSLFTSKLKLHVPLKIAVFGPKCRDIVPLQHNSLS